MKKENYLRRQQQVEQSCASTKSFNTTYNDNDKVRAFTGIMFEMDAKTDLEILTFELDVHLDKATDLAVEVYSRKGMFAEYENAPESWDLIANSTLVPAPEGVGAIIPNNGFVPVFIPNREKQSFYVTMKGPYLDNTVNALQRTGEFHTSTDDMKLLVGSGFTEYRFGNVDSDVNPQFAGIIHYKKTGDCSKLTDKTVVEFMFVLSTKADNNLVDSVNSAVDSTLNELMEKNDALKQYSEEHGLEKIGIVKTQEIPLAERKYCCQAERRNCYILSSHLKNWFNSFMY